MMKKEIDEVVEFNEKKVKEVNQQLPKSAKEINGRSGPEPTRYGDWEKNGRCIDF
ncbi:MAG: DUF1674 domain-containing protein [Cycloclasticus sp.]|nr:DUF1674 domain-containing protein [Cycloclasticus sp.]